MSSCILWMYFCPACRSDHSLRRQLEAVAALKLNTAELHQSKISLSPVNGSVVIRCPVILIRFEKQFSTAGQRSRIKGDSGKSGHDKGGSNLICPSCGHPCSKEEVFMCRLRFTLKPGFHYPS